MQAQHEREHALKGVVCQDAGLQEAAEMGLRCCVTLSLAPAGGDRSAGQQGRQRFRSHYICRTATSAGHHWWGCGWAPVAVACTTSRVVAVAEGRRWSQLQRRRCQQISQGTSSTATPMLLSCRAATQCHSCVQLPSPVRHCCTLSDPYA
jgi:hypothetical protein